MGKIELTPELKGSLAETYYKEYCDQKGQWAYTSLEVIDKIGFKEGKLEFKFGFKRYLIKIPQEILSEIKEISRAKYLEPNNPSYVFDFLACKIYEGDEDVTEILNRSEEDFSWVEVKSQGSRLSNNQHDTLEKTKIRFTLCVVKNVGSENDDIYLKFYYDVVPQSMLPI